MSGPGHTRRDALKIFSAGAAGLVAGCRPAREAVPYRDMPEGMVPGKPLYFATSLPLCGAGRGVLVESHQGRPTKVHGNPLHPASLGGTDVFAEGAVLDLFDPSRPAAPTRAGAPTSWSALWQAVEAAADQDGAVLLTGPVGSPTLARQIGTLLAARPGLRWVSYSPVMPQLHMGAAQVWPDFDRLDAVVSLGADPLGPGPAQVAFAKGWSAARRARRMAFCSHAFEAGPTLTGAQADRRTAVRPSDMPQIAQDLLAALDGAQAAPPVAAAAQMLRGAKGRAAVLVGCDQPAAVQRAARAINDRLSAPLRYWRAFDHWPDITPEPMGALTADMDAGRVPALIVLDANPVYDLDSAFADALARVPARLHFGTHGSETAAACTWHGPLHHALEDWSDLRSLDGTAGLVQPLIAPLHDSRSAHAVLARLTGSGTDAPLEILRQTWREKWGADGFEDRWRRALHDGVIGGTGPEEMPAPPLPAATAPPPRTGGLDVVLKASPQVFDGRFAPNAWLQECPDPFSKQVWGNAAWLSPQDASAAGIMEGDLVELIGDGGTAILPALLLDGQAPGSVTLHLGHGRDQAGPVGTGVGARVPHLGAAVSLRKTGAEGAPARVQTEFSQHGRDILRTASDVLADAAGPPPPTLYPDHDYDSYAWGMVIDTDACIGCNACMIACQSENNIPVVGPDEIRRGRNMHWMRVDRYEMDEGASGFQPVPCMHCEKAPCEPVCPVEASVHDSEGLNVQVYNRCIGTRFCQANCPYKVRRFNFFDYAERETFEAGGADLLPAMRNPDVSVRARGVMEKCTYCVQRISSARREAKKEDRPIADGEVVTACQSACPADAISFGNLNDPAAAVSRAKTDPRHYALLEELGTRPRTTYLARVTPDDGGGT